MATTFTWTKTASGTSSDWNSSTGWKSSGAPGVPGATGSTDVVDLSPALNTLYTVTISHSDGTFNLGSLSIGGASGTGHGTNLDINGFLNTGSLAFTGTADQAKIDIGVGGSFEVGTTITSTIAETITVEATGAGGIGSGGVMAFGTASSSGFAAALANANITYSFDNNGSGKSTGVIEFNDYTAGTTVTAAQKVTNLAAGDEFIISGGNFTGATMAINSGTLTATEGTSVVKFTGLTFGSLTATNFVGNGDAIQIVVCYVRGTRIATVRGEVAIENLAAGDLIVTASGEIQPVKWIGARRLDLTTHPRPETVAPIRILQGAFGDQMPHRDLLVSPDHAIFVDGKLICARQLVNGTTILQEMGWTAVDYFHVELAQHAILLAEGLPAESYIDTGNSGFFSNSGAPLTLHPDLTDESDYPTREAGSCAPFASDEASVHPVWQRLADRAVALGKPVPQHATTTDAGLHLVAKGKTVKPMYCDGNLAIFALPRHASEVRLVSRAQSPTEARPWLEDRRKLGVRVARVVLRSADDLREIPVDHPSLSKGWWAIERDGVAMRRWTDGDAIVPLPAMEGDALLEVHLGGTMTYVAETETAPERRVA